jgi:DHA1 family bicyclomycin/chloramphenicol resistance-like MFS transporter
MILDGSRKVHDMQGQTIKINFRTILILGLLTAIAPMSIDMYLPAFPAIAENLHTSVSQVTLSLSSFFVGISAGQLLYGPLIERFGRKPPLYVGLCLFFVASVGCSLSPSIGMLIAFRFLQAVGGCVGMVAARAMVRDLFDTKDNARVFSLLMLVVSVSPIIAPALGGYITSVLGWRYVFAVLIFLVELILIGTYYFLPESKKADPAYSLRPTPILRNFREVLGHPAFLTYALTGAVSYAGLYAYIGGAPYVFMQLFRLSEGQFGWIFSIIAAGLISASQVNNIALKHYNSDQIIRTASICQSLIGTAFVILVLLGVITLNLTVLSAFLFLACQGFIFPNATALALKPMGNSAGNASALIGTIQMAVGAGAAALISVLQNHTALPMAVVMTSCSVTALIIFSIGRKFLIRKADDKYMQKEAVETVTDF